ncbi:MAG TPA: Kdo hydroxylase family protein [Thermoanaerobaculia bacterium]|jgi:hypothetical protein
MALVDVDALTGPPPDGAAGDTLARALEQGGILLFRRPPFPIPDEDRDFLLSRRQGGGRLHKNIAYRPARDRVTGAAGSRADVERLHRILRTYSRATLEFLARRFPGYARSWHVDYASFRPIEEEGRSLPQTSRNDLMHVDAFPTRPTHGNRILRFFTNIHPTRAREWVSGGTFDRLAPRYAVDSGLLADALHHARPSAAARLLRAVGARRELPSAYDVFMLRFHDFLKNNAEFQAGEKETFSFPPGSSWMVLTDMVSHAVLSGQFALEQTVILSRESLVAPESAPIAILERLAGTPLAAPSIS